MAKRNKRAVKQPEEVNIVVEKATLLQTEAAEEEVYKTLPRRKKPLMFVALVIIAVLLTTGIFLAARAIQSSSPIPKSIQQQVSYGVFLPASESQLKVDKNSVRYDSSTKVLSYTLRAANATISLNQQATPDSFNDVPQAYTKLVNSLQTYASIDTANGTVALTTPAEFHGGQSAVLNAKGTLLFARPSTSLSNDDWRRLFNSLQLQTF